jgi:2-polyprenyl-6-methoxyphenol hydroxylase-like FAD-dependent oxidoreductase
VAGHGDRTGPQVTADGMGLLVVGAGPTGLALALQAYDHGARVRIVERRVEPFRPSRALVVQPRTLEVLRPLGVTDALMANGEVSPSVEIHLGSRVILVRVEDLDLADTPFPHLLLIRQADVERVLWRALEDRGVEIERGVEVEDVAALHDHARVTLRRAGTVAEVACRHVVGCDGPASVVRSRAGVRWEGRPYRQEAVLADVELSGTLRPDVAHVVPARNGVLFLFPIGEQATWRLLATRPAGGDDLAFGQLVPAVPGGDLQGLIDEAGLDVTIRDVGWSGRVRLQHRLASHYRRGPLFIAGDAAHAHSPAAAQGMNTGLQDATNLGWKLAFSAGALPYPGDAEVLLDSYELERRPVAAQVLTLTRLVFWLEAGTDPVATAARRIVSRWSAPLLPTLMRRRRLLAAGIRTLSQFKVRYRHSPLSIEGSPVIQGVPGPGERLPDAVVTTEEGIRRLHDLIARPGVHALLQRDAAAIDTSSIGIGLRVQRITSWPGTGIVLVRPDGHVGLRCGVTDHDQVRHWLSLVSFADRPPAEH